MLILDDAENAWKLPFWAIVAKVSGQVFQSQIDSSPMQHFFARVASWQSESTDSEYLRIFFEQAITTLDALAKWDHQRESQSP
ncbi:hypothetical protein HY229_00870 [Candidatus Acetothermia bacterium]|nr:hypothetical protein [Candidatus Acetothermia bacterium]MBI3642643.1 hypothetical protein [Candidatus Acetothermia bacterium]